MSFYQTMILYMWRQIGEAVEEVLQDITVGHEEIAGDEMWGNKIR